MNCGSSWRPPRRPALAGRLVLLTCVLILMLGPAAGPAAAYNCRPSPPTAKGAARTPAAHVPHKSDCEPAQPRAKRRGNADPMSFMFFIGILLAVVLVPVALGRREDLPPE